MNEYIDYEFKEAVWNSKIPVKIDIALEDINDIETPPSLYVIEQITSLIYQESDILQTIFPK